MKIKTSLKTMKIKIKTNYKNINMKQLWEEKNEENFIKNRKQWNWGDHCD